MAELTRTELKIIRQVEYYFGDINLPRDRFLQTLVKKNDGWVPLKTMAKFNRLEQITDDLSAIAHALKKSTSGLIEVNEDGTKLRRSPDKAMPENTEERRQDVTARTVYAKVFPLDATLDEIMAFFETYGPMETICLRKDANKVFNGSVFATFKSKDDFDRFVKAEEVKYKDTTLEARKSKSEYLKEAMTDGIMLNGNKLECRVLEGRIKNRVLVTGGETVPPTMAEESVMDTGGRTGPLRTTEEGVTETGEDTGTTTMAVPATSDIDGGFISIHGGHITNEAGAIVSKITDLDYVMRFLILGRTELIYEAGRSGLKLKDQTKGRDYIERLIKEKKRLNVVCLIKEISTNNRNISQDPVLYCLALCARRGDEKTKKEAYRILNEVCRIPTDLFQFIEYYTVLAKQSHTYESVQEKEDKLKEKLKKKQDKLKRGLDEKNETRKQNEKLKLQHKKVNDHAAYGWGRAFKRAISKWFLNFEPEYLAYLLTKYRRRYGWSVKAVIRLAHVKSPDITVTRVGAHKQIALREGSTDKQKAIGFILRYFRSNLTKAREFYQAGTFEEGSTVGRVAGMLADYDALRTSLDADFIKNKITSDIKRLRSPETDPNRKHAYFTIEHISTKVISRSRRNVAIWRSLIPCIPGDALIRHVGFLTELDLFKATTDSNLLTKTIKSFEKRLNEFVRPPAPATERPYTTKRPIHPLRLHIAILQYEEGRTAHGGLNWSPVQRVTDTMQQAFEDSYANNIHKISKRMCVAIDVSGSMKKTVNGKTYGIECRKAAAALAYTLARIGSNVNLLIFSKSGSETLSGYNNFEDFLSKVKESSLGKSKDSDCTEPLKWAFREKRTDTEAFVVFTVNENARGVNEPVKGLQDYRNACGNTKVKLIICTMNATNYTGSDRADPYIMDICGCDRNLPLLIEEFVSHPRRESSRPL